MLLLEVVIGIFLDGLVLMVLCSISAFYFATRRVTFLGLLKLADCAE
jgi:hypothetical protein